MESTVTDFLFMIKLKDPMISKGMDSKSHVMFEWSCAMLCACVPSKNGIFKSQ